MQFEYRYFGSSAVDSSASGSAMRFAPDTRRPATFFKGSLGDKLAFREAICALHDVVVSDLRFKPKDRSEYLAWRSQQDELDELGLGAQRADVKRELAAVRKELDQLHRQRGERWSEFYKARQRYFNYLWRKDREAWYVLDPVITVHPDELFFECFSEDESTYGRLGCGYEVFDEVGEFACGTTNIDYSDTLFDEFSRIRGYKSTTFEVDPSGFELATTGADSYREVKIDLPDSWVRGFLQVSAAMTLQGARCELHPMDLYNLCLLLRRNRERKGPRSLRWHLKPGQPVTVTLDPWGIELQCPRSTYTGDREHRLRTWGRRRLHILERLLPVADSVQLTLLGDGLPYFFVVKLGQMNFTLGLSGWTANDWAKGGNFDLLVPRTDVDSHTSQRVFDALRQRWLATPEQLCKALGLERGVVVSALNQWTQAGRVMYDLDKGLWRARELSREPLPMQKLRFSNEREQTAARLINNVTVLHASATSGGGLTLRAQVQDGGRNERPRLTLTADSGLAQAACSCNFYSQNRLRRGPCAHILAMRLAHQRRHGVVS